MTSLSKWNCLAIFQWTSVKIRLSLQFFLPLLVHRIFSLFPEGDLQTSKSFLPLWSQPHGHFASTVVVTFTLSLKANVIYANGSQDFLIIWILNTTYFIHESPVFIFLVLQTEYKCFTVTVMPWHEPALLNAQPYSLCVSLIHASFQDVKNRKDSSVYEFMGFRCPSFQPKQIYKQRKWPSLAAAFWKRLQEG